VVTTNENEIFFAKEEKNNIWEIWVKVEAMSGELWVGVIIFYAWGWDESVKVGQSYGYYKI